MSLIGESGDEGVGCGESGDEGVWCGESKREHCITSQVDHILQVCDTQTSTTTENCSYL